MEFFSRSETSVLVKRGKVQRNYFVREANFTCRKLPYGIGHVVGFFPLVRIIGIFFFFFFDSRSQHWRSLRAYRKKNKSGTEANRKA